MSAAYFEDHPTDPDKVILRKPSLEQAFAEFAKQFGEYKAPDNSRWVGLTEDEVFALSNTMPYADRFEFAKAIEDKLKEKNG
jgi:hypothetical protein